MRANLDHDIFKKKAESLALNKKVEKFLAKQGKTQPDQLPFGYSALNKHQTSQEAMRYVMAASIEKSGIKIQPVSEKSLSSEQKRHQFNAEARKAALNVGLNEFTGKCAKHDLTPFRAYRNNTHHCIACRVLIVKRRKETMA